MPKTKVTRRKTRSTSGSRADSSKGKQKGRRKSDLQIDDDSYKMCHIPARKQITWKPLSTGTKDYIRHAMDINSDTVLTQARPTNYETTQETLNEFQYRCMQKIDRLKAPVSRLGNYQSIEKQAKLLEERVARTSHQAEKLLDEIESQERALEDREAQVHRLNSQIEESRAELDELKTNLNPLLQAEYSDPLHLSPLPTASLTRPDPSDFIAEGSSEELIGKLTTILNKSQNKDKLSTLCTITEDITGHVIWGQ